MINFLCIGVQKAATSWLHKRLGSHPQIETSDPKELDFFSTYFNRGYTWYERHFDSRGSDIRRGEASPSYFHEADVPARVRAYNSDMRLVAILRDPVSRAFSNHLHELRKGHIPPDTSFEDGSARNPMYVAQGYYATHLSRWLEHFDRNALLVLFAEEIDADPVDAFNSVCRHLDVSEMTPERLAERRHQNIGYRNESLQKTLRTFGDAARSVGMERSVDWLKDQGPVRAMLKRNERDLRQTTPPMRPQTRAALREEFAPEMARLAEMLGRESLPFAGFGSAGKDAAPAPHSDKTPVPASL